MAPCPAFQRLAAVQRHVLAPCAVAAPSEGAGLSYSDDYIKGILQDVRTIAMVGASTQWNRPSYFAMKYLQGKGYRVIPVNLAAKGQTILGELVYGDLAEIPESTSLDMVDVFRNSEAAGMIADQAIAMKAARGIKVLWMQLGVVNQAAAQRATSAGLNVVMDRCPKIEYSRLYRELGQHGFDSGVISSRRRPVGTPGKRSSPGGGGGDSAPKPVFVGFETKAIHAGAAPDASTGARVTPIYQNTSYVFEDVDHAASLFNLSTFGNIYSRLTNPTVAVLEERVASLEGGRGATGTSSGHAAQLVALFCLMQPGDRIVASNKLYGGSITQFGKTIKKFNWECTFVDVDDHEQVRKALQDPSVRLLFAESLANPGGVVSDIRAIADLAHAAQVPLVIDNTLATPYLCRPIEFGADLVVHSTTKFLSGQGSALGGIIVDSGRFDWSKVADKYPSLARPEPAYHGLTFSETFGDMAFTMFAHAVGLRDIGATMAPMHAFLTIQGCETLSVRMDRHVANALRVASFLEAHPKVAWVSYAGLPSSKYHSLAQRYLRGGAGGAVFTFGVKGGYGAGVQTVERVELFSHLANVGDTRSLILHPASTTHRQLTDEQRAASGAGDDVLRLSIGLESPEDLIADLDFALSQAS
uniref:CoA-binding domain-containing protein n=1 Tax=Alexandrium catenella TaxID=2925 RepID=A0A7S1RG01_ALECA